MTRVAGSSTSGTVMPSTDCDGRSGTIAFRHAVNRARYGRRPDRITCLLLFLSLSLNGLVGTAVAANPVASGIELQAETNNAGIRSQQEIDTLWEDTRLLREQYRQTERELEGLRSYDLHLERMVGAQEEAIAGLESQLEEAQDIQRAVIPLLARMLDSLARFVELDRPFLLDERRQRVNTLKALLDSPSATVAEKYRRTMEAYQVEVEYGRTLETYRGTLSIGGNQRSVDFLRVGRVALFYRSLDQSESGVWDQVKRNWVRLPDNYLPSLKQAYRVASRQLAPELLTLPVQVSEVAP